MVFISYPAVNIFCNLSKNTMISKLEICDDLFQFPDVTVVFCDRSVG